MHAVLGMTGSCLYFSAHSSSVCVPVFRPSLLVCLAAWLAAGAVSVPAARPARVGHRDAALPALRGRAGGGAPGRIRLHGSVSQSVHQAHGLTSSPATLTPVRLSPAALTPVRLK